MPYFMNGCAKTINTRAQDVSGRARLEEKGCRPLRGFGGIVEYCCPGRAAERFAQVGLRGDVPTDVRTVTVLTAKIPGIKLAYPDMCSFTVTEGSKIAKAICPVEIAQAVKDKYGLKIGGLTWKPPTLPQLAPRTPLLPGAPSLTRAVTTTGHVVQPSEILYEEQVLPEDGFMNRALDWAKTHPVYLLGGAAAAVTGVYFLLTPRIRKLRVVR